MNQTFQSADRVALFRNAAGGRPVANIPLPTNLAPGTETSVFGMPRQELDLSKQHIDLFASDRNGCSVPRSIDVTELTSSRLALTYREAASCEVPECSVEYQLDLIDAACPRDCDSTGATLHADASGSMIWRCDCR